MGWELVEAEEDEASADPQQPLLRSVSSTNRFMGKLMRKNDIPVHAAADDEAEEDDGMTSQSSFNCIGRSSAIIVVVASWSEMHEKKKTNWGQTLRISFAGRWFGKDRKGAAADL